MLHCLGKPQVAADTANRAISEELKGLMGWIANKQIDYAGITSADYIQYYLGMYTNLEKGFGQLADAEETTMRLSDYFKVHVVTVSHPDSGEMKIQTCFTEGAAPILHLEAFPGMYYAMLPGNTEGMPLEGTKTAIEQYYSLYLPNIQPPQQLPPNQDNPPVPASIDLSQSVPRADPIWRTAPQLSQSQPLPDPGWPSAMKLIETQKKVIQSLALANSSIHLGPDTVQLLADAVKLAESLKMDGREYQNIIAQLERSAASEADSAAVLPSGKSDPVKTKPPSTNPPAKKGPPAVPSEPKSKSPSNPAAKPGSIPRPAKASKPPGCQTCGEPNLSMLYIDGDHRPCQVCYACCSKATHCPVCKREYTPAEKSRFQLITS
jgi:hypothetical protein